MTELAELKSENKILKDSNINLQELYQTERQKVKKAKQKVLDMCRELQTAKAQIERLKRENDSNFDKWKLLADRTNQRYAELYEEAKEVLKAEAVKEFAKEIQTEIAEALQNNYKVKKERIEKTDNADSFVLYVQGKIEALQGTDVFIDNLLKETVGD